MVVVAEKVVEAALNSLLSVRLPLRVEMVAEVDLNPLLVSSLVTVRLPLIVDSVEEVDLKSLIVTCPLTVVRVADVDRKLLAVASPDKVTVPEKVGLPPTVVKVADAALKPP